MRKSPTKDEEFRKLTAQMAAWKIPSESLDRVHDAARASFAEVKALTEYEDGKASRLLTVVAFLSAVVAAVFTRFAADFVPPSISAAACTWTWGLPAATYLSFLAYILLVTWSVYEVLGAIRPTFNLPKTWTAGPASSSPLSMLFYQRILDVTASTWGTTFEQLASNAADDLKSTYAKRYVIESYLIAEKVAAKLKALEPGIRHLRWAMGVLVVFFALFAATLLAVQPTRSAPVRSLALPLSGHP